MLSRVFCRSGPKQAETVQGAWTEACVLMETSACSETASRSTSTHQGLGMILHHLDSQTMADLSVDTVEVPLQPATGVASPGDTSSPCKTFCTSGTSVTDDASTSHSRSSTTCDSQTDGKQKIQTNHLLHLELRRLASIKSNFNVAPQDAAPIARALSSAAADSVSSSQDISIFEYAVDQALGTFSESDAGSNPHPHRSSTRANDQSLSEILGDLVNHSTSVISRQQVEIRCLRAALKHLMLELLTTTRDDAHHKLPGVIEIQEEDSSGSDSGDDHEIAEREVRSTPQHYELFDTTVADIDNNKLFRRSVPHPSELKPQDSDRIHSEGSLTQGSEMDHSTTKLSRLEEKLVRNKPRDTGGSKDVDSNTEVISNVRGSRQTCPQTEASSTSHDVGPSNEKECDRSEESSMFQKWKASVRHDFEALETTETLQQQLTSSSGEIDATETGLKAVSSFDCDFESPLADGEQNGLEKDVTLFSEPQALSDFSQGEDNNFESEHERTLQSVSKDDLVAVAPSPQKGEAAEQERTSEPNTNCMLEDLSDIIAQMRTETRSSSDVEDCSENQSLNQDSPVTDFSAAKSSYADPTIGALDSTIESKTTVSLEESLAIKGVEEMMERLGQLKSPPSASLVSKLVEPNEDDTVSTLSAPDTRTWTDGLLGKEETPQQNESEPDHDVAATEAGQRGAYSSVEPSGTSTIDTTSQNNSQQSSPISSPAADFEATRLRDIQESLLSRAKRRKSRCSPDDGEDDRPERPRRPSYQQRPTDAYAVEPSFTRVGHTPVMILREHRDEPLDGFMFPGLENATLEQPSIIKLSASSEEKLERTISTSSSEQCIALLESLVVDESSSFDQFYDPPMDKSY